ncbi:hypothetical protein [Neolewinella antarctica]|uniref:Cellobiose phosphorylase n=1 Tax=Neolewinella antarctica TaxID=442734 RepID=A0ABX0XAF2_9BACT|nr:hypothetical protein [Neolewinella antarctica]NJC26259.1 hypothetical protein [Neolewinella antarctica]
MSKLERVQIKAVDYFKITNVDQMRPFLMSVVSDANHWLFISSNGGLTAGRKNSEFALFPYYTDDKITEFAETTGSKSIFRIGDGDAAKVWEPFSLRDNDRYETTNNVYKSTYGDRIIFEEINHDLGLTFSYEWCSSQRFGFVRNGLLRNTSDKNISVELIDGIRNIVPAGVGSELQNRSSNLVDAYKRNQLDQKSGVGIFALSAIIVDKAEPSESLSANVVWSIGLSGATRLLSSRQLNAFREGGPVREETDVKGEKGAYYLCHKLNLPAGEAEEWTMVADVNKNQSDVVSIIHQLSGNGELRKEIMVDVASGTQKLISLVGASDGLQKTGDEFRDARHFSNVLFNIMRGGTFDDGYNIEGKDFSQYLKKANLGVFNLRQKQVDALGEEFTVFDLRSLTDRKDEPDFRRLVTEYLPLKFSRRHGDPSRPWNKFSINTQSEVDGSKILDYEGNWRDIFQNWEALAHSYPEFMEGMIHKFLNATTFDGYNPYRVTKDGFDWEAIEEDDPWSYIGYWGDHQIIYLLKFLEFIEVQRPQVLHEVANESVFVYANVPYKIKPYDKIVEDPKDTVDFDRSLDESIREKRSTMGADGALLTTSGGELYRVTFIEKMLATTLAKVSNFIPEGGIWMNTQRPEWNDANNALVGNGVSMVTLYYLRRFLTFFKKWTAELDLEEVDLSGELLAYFDAVHQILRDHEVKAGDEISDKQRKKVVDGLGQAASTYRWKIYDSGFSGKQGSLSLANLTDFLTVSLAHLDHSIEANQRADKLFHAYNLIDIEKDGFGVSHLEEMLEGQVAVLSAEYLNPQRALNVIEALSKSSLYRKDQNSYILYPNKELPGFLDKNTIPADRVEKSKLLTQMLEAGDQRIVSKDLNGEYHFSAEFRNVKDLRAVLKTLSGGKFGQLPVIEKTQLEAAFEAVFNHKAFTGRSGTFYGYEGLGSIYWHMVSKLQLAVMENYQMAVREEADDNTITSLLQHYRDVAEGTGLHKSPELYGAFPTDPYSHTPGGKGAQQPGMTGQVKEDILSRLGELGISVTDGRLTFAPTALRRSDFLREASTFSYVDTNSRDQKISVSKDAIAFTHCQLPIIYRLGERKAIEVKLTDGTANQLHSLQLDRDTSREVFMRSGTVERITVTIPESQLK